MQTNKVNFASEVLKIPKGSTLNFMELERQEEIYNMYVSLGRTGDYNINMGLLQVIR